MGAKVKSGGIRPLRLQRERAPLPTPARALDRPVAKVLVDTGLLHLDQDFDFLIPEELSSQIAVGSLVKVLFNRRRTLGVVLDRSSRNDFKGDLKYISEVVKPLPILQQNILQLSNEIKKYYGGTRWDVLRFAIPALSKKKSTAEEDRAHFPRKNFERSTDLQASYPEGFWEALEQDPKVISPLRVFWSAPPVDDPFEFLAEVALRKVNQEGTVLIVLPDAADCERMSNLLQSKEILHPREVVCWHSELSRSERENIFLKVLEKEVRIVVGVRGSLLLPLDNLSLILFWDEADESYSEKKSPYFHGREVAIMRSHIDRAHLIFGGFSPSVALVRYIQQNYLTPLKLNSELLKSKLPKVRALTDRDSPQEMGDVPTIAWQILKKGLQTGPVLVVFPIKGYIQGLSCRRCLNRALCACGGNLIWRQERRTSECNICGVTQPNWMCPHCGTREFRNSQLGDSRIAEVLGKSFPNQRVISSNAERRVLQVEDEPLVVVSTPGAQPRAAHGYSAIAILNSRVYLNRANLAAEEQTRRLWFESAGLLKLGGEVFIDVDSSNRNLHALMRWEPLSVAMKELEERASVNLPPASKSVLIAGEHQAVRELVQNLPRDVFVSHPRIENGESISLLRITGPKYDAVIQELFARARSQSAKGAPIARISIDPITL